MLFEYLSGQNVNIHARLMPLLDIQLANDLRAVAS